PADLWPGAGRRPRRGREPPRRAPAARLRARAAGPAPGDDGGRLPRVRRRHEGRRGPARATRRGRGGDRARGAPRRRRRADRHAVEGLPPARRPRAGPGGRPADPPPRRADRRPRPRALGRDAPIDPRPRRRACRAGLEPCARGGGRSLRPGRHPAPRPRARRRPACRARGAAPSDLAHRGGSGGAGGRARGGARRRAGGAARRPGGTRERSRALPGRGGTRRGRARAPGRPRHGARLGPPGARAPRGVARGGLPGARRGPMKTLLICRRELAALFGGPLAYGLAAVFVLLTGYFFYSDLVLFVLFGGASLPAGLWRFVFLDYRLVALLVLPLLTMRLLAEERKLGTLELLWTYPVRDREVLAGKFLAALVVYLPLLAMTASGPLV